MFGRGKVVLKGCGTLPDRSVLHQMAKASYEATPPPMIEGWRLIDATPTLKFYANENRIVVAIRGTSPTDKADVEADAKIPLNRLETTARYQGDMSHLLDMMKRYPTSQYEYYGVGHSLGGAILDSFIREGWIRNGVSYNPAVQPRDFKRPSSNQRIYQQGDPLYAVMGRFTPNAEVRPPKRGILDRLVRKIPYVGRIIGAYQDHQLGNFEGGSLTHKKRVLKKYGLEDEGYSLTELAKITGVSRKTLQEVYNRGIGAYKTNPLSVRMKGSFKKNVNAPMSQKLSKEQWAMSRVWSFLDGNPKHDNDLRGGRRYEPQYPAIRQSFADMWNRMTSESEEDWALPLPPEEYNNVEAYYDSHRNASYEQVKGYAKTRIPIYGELVPEALIRLLSNNIITMEAYLSTIEELNAILRASDRPEPYIRFPVHLIQSWDSILHSASQLPPIVAYMYPPVQGSGSSTRFSRELEAIGLSPSAYLREARRRAKASGYESKALTFADDGTHKLAMKDEKGRQTKFGRVGYKDHLMWSHLERKGSVPKGTAEAKKERFQKSHGAMKGEWRTNRYSANNLALRVLW